MLPVTSTIILASTPCFASLCHCLLPSSFSLMLTTALAAPVVVKRGQNFCPTLYYNIFIFVRLVHSLRMEHVVYHDCLYRNINRYEFVTFLDSDEVIMPKEEETRNFEDLVKMLAREG